MNINIESLKNFLLENTKYFEQNKTDIDTLEEIERFKMREAKNIIFPGEYFLCDVYGNQMWICKLLEPGKSFKLKNGRRVGCEPVAMVIDECQNIFYTFNGCWKIPEQFYKN